MTDENERRLVFLVAREPLWRAALTAFLTQNGFEVIGEAPSASDAVVRTSFEQAQVVLLDLPEVGPLNAIATLAGGPTLAPLFVLAGKATDPGVIRETLAAGAAAFISRAIEPTDLTSVLRHPPAPGLVVAPRAVAGPSEVLGHSPLTGREVEILKAVARGLSNPEISRELSVAEPTVKFHLTNIYRKLGVKNRTEAARWAIATGVIGGVSPRTAEARAE